MRMSIGELGRRSGLPTSTIRYYEEVGVLARSSRVSGRRVFEEPDLDRLLVVSFAQEAGFSLREIRQLFDGFASDTPAGMRWKTLATAKLAELESAATRIEAMKTLLKEALRCGCIELESCGRLFRTSGSPGRDESSNGVSPPASRSRRPSAAEVRSGEATRRVVLRRRP